MVTAPRWAYPGCPSPEHAARTRHHRRRPGHELDIAGHLPAECFRQLPSDPFGRRISVTPIHRISRRSCRRISSPNRSRNDIVGTTNKSIAAMPLAWLWRNVFHPCDGGRLTRGMYLATVVCPTSMPSFSSSPWIRGAPQSGLARLTSRMSRRISSSAFGRPPRGFDFQRHQSRKPARCQRITVSGLTMVRASSTLGATRYSTDNMNRSTLRNAGLAGTFRCSTLSC